MRVAHGQVWSVTLDPHGGQRAALHRSLCGRVHRQVQPPADPAGHRGSVDDRGSRVPHHIVLADDGGLNRPSWAMCETVRAVSLERFSQLISTANADAVAAITNQLTLWFGHPSWRLIARSPWRCGALLGEVLAQPKPDPQIWPVLSRDGRAQSD